MLHLGKLMKTKTTCNLNYLERGFYYSLSYERNLATINNIKIGSNIGLSIFPGLTSLEPSTEILVPIEINFSFNKSNNEFLIGAGTTFWKYHINSVNITNANLNQQPINAELISAKEWFAHCSFEYRLRSKTKSIFYKLGYVPLFFDFTPNSKFSRSINYQTSFTIGIGWTF
tara:strand:- start:16 stop:531 length:516 start_codon:yes stop_codon:yes gene_type:complete